MHSTLLKAVPYGYCSSRLCIRYRAALYASFQVMYFQKTKEIDTCQLWMPRRLNSVELFRELPPVHTFKCFIKSQPLGRSNLVDTKAWLFPDGQVSYVHMLWSPSYMLSLCVPDLFLMAKSFSWSLMTCHVTIHPFSMIVK